jgi:DNA-binding PadR family transcriptional regulator
MEQSGWLRAHWGESETNRKAKFYALTRTGRAQLERETGRWQRISGAMAQALAQ